MSKRIGVRIQHPEIWEEFREFVQNKWGKKHTAMALELENALKIYMEALSEKNTRTHEHSEDENDPKPMMNGGSPETTIGERISNGEKTKKKIVGYMKRNGMMEAENIHENAIRIVIGKIAGWDKRTIDKYFRLLDMDDLLPKNMEREAIRRKRAL